MNQLHAEVGRLRQEVEGVAAKLAGVEVEEDALVVRGGLEVLAEEEEEGVMPTVLTGRMIYTDELECGVAHIQNLRVGGLEVSGPAPVLGPTGCRGPPGYATNTGATGPQGVCRFSELVDCPSGYKPGACLIGTPTGIAFGGLAYSGRSVACRVVRSGPLVRKRGVWCHELGDLVFLAQLDGGTVRLVLGFVGGAEPTRLELATLMLTNGSPLLPATPRTTTIELPAGECYREVCLDPILVPEEGALLQGTLTGFGACLVHVSATQ